MSEEVEQIVKSGVSSEGMDGAQDYTLTRALLVMSMIVLSMQALFLLVMKTSFCQFDGIGQEFLGLLYFGSLVVAAITLIVGIIAFTTGAKSRKRTVIAMGISFASTLLLHVALVIDFLLNFSY